MRPSDEDQQTSTRPDLLSRSKRSGQQDDKILATLDRASPPKAAALANAAPVSGSWRRGRVSLLVIALAGMAWLTLDTARSPATPPYLLTQVSSPASAPLTAVAASAIPAAVMPAAVTGAAALAPAVAAPIALAAGPAPVAVEASPDALGAPLLGAALIRNDEAANARILTGAPVPAPAAAIQPAAKAGASHAAPPRLAPTRVRKAARTAPAGPEAPLDSDVALLAAIVAHGAPPPAAPCAADAPCAARSPTAR